MFQGFGCRVHGLVFGVLDLGVGVQCSRFRGH